MTLADVLERPSLSTASSVPQGRWVAALGEPGGARQGQGTVVTATGRGASLRLIASAGDSRPSSAVTAGAAVVFDGVLHDRARFDAELGGAPPASDAERVARAYARWGEGLFARLSAIYALALWDASRETLLVVRDRMGIYPCYYADADGELLVSSSLDAIVAQPGVDASPNRVAIADRLAGRWLLNDETLYAGVRRLPAGHLLRARGNERRVVEYWDPAPLGQPVDWVKGDAVEQFADAFERAVSRCLESGPAGLFLSGGLDSVSIGAMAAQNSETRGYPVPWALSLAFPDPDVNEEPVQRGVATALGFPQVMVPLDEAVGPEGLTVAGLELSRTSPQPLLNFWLPAYMHLAAQGKERGCTTILTGSGGDEWLGVSPYLGADLLLRGRVGELYKLWATQRKSYTASSFNLFKDLTWHFGARPILTGAAVQLLKRTVPGVLTARKRQFIAQTTPAWLAPDAALRRELDQRTEQRLGQPEFGQFYMRAMHQGLGHLVPSTEAEETFEAGRRLGQRKLSPYWDADLVGLLFRVTPEELNRGGRSKGLVRQTMARRFPHLGFGAQKKIVSRNYFGAVVERDWSKAWAKSRGTPTLEGLGIVNERTLDASATGAIAEKREGLYFRMWDSVNLEVWARDRF